MFHKDEHIKCPQETFESSYLQMHLEMIKGGIEVFSNSPKSTKLESRGSGVQTQQKALSTNSRLHLLFSLPASITRK